MHKVLMTGHAESATEAFDFKLGEWVNGIGLLVRHTGYAEPKETGAGIWPSVEKAKDIADQMVKRLLGPEAVVSWIEISDQKNAASE